MGRPGREVSPQKAHLAGDVTERDPRRPGVTVVELLMIIVLLAMAVAIILPEFTERKQHGELTTLREDLRRLVVAEQGYFATHGTYTTSFPRDQFAPSSGVTIADWTTSPTGWSARANHKGPATAAPITCHVTVDMSSQNREGGAPICP
jgi:type II secretory pathway pseudopilin PulG